MTSEFDPDLTPVVGTPTSRSWTLLHDPRIIRRIGGRSPDAPPSAGAWRTLTYVLGGVWVVLAVLLIIDIASPSAFSGLRNVESTRRPSGHSAPATDKHAHHNSSPPSGPGPVLTSLSPQDASPGSTIVLTGTGFFSANHQIVARVAGHPAPTSCPTRERCLVVLPAARNGTTSTSVQIVTSVGSSNSLTVHYG